MINKHPRSLDTERNVSPINSEFRVRLKSVVDQERSLNETSARQQLTKNENKDDSKDQNIKDSQVNIA